MAYSGVLLSYNHSISFPSFRFTVEVLSLGSPTRARIVTTQMLDREDVDTYRLTIVGGDRTSSPLSSTVSVTISLLDLNDDPPTFDQSMWVFELIENINSAMVVNFNVRKKLCVYGED